MIIKKLEQKKLIQPPKWLSNNTHYLTVMGSIAYGCNESNSDYDCYGFCIPPKEMIFPHLNGEIMGFGKQTQRFEQWQQHHIKDNDKKIEYDFAIYNIVKYFHLVMENNPNMIDSLFTPQRCVLHCTQIGQHVRDNRKLFVHKGCLSKFRGYSFSQRSKIINKTNAKNEKRADSIDKHGYDVKYAVHLIRLLLECEQLLIFGEMDIQRDREIYKAIRKGEWTLEQIDEFFMTKEKALEELYNTSKIPYEPDEDKIKQILIDCLEMHYGKLDNSVIVVKKNDSLQSIIDEMENSLDKLKSLNND